MKRSLIAGCVASMMFAGFVASGAYAAESTGTKIGYVDLGRAFSGYEKAAELDKELSEFAESTQAKRTTMVQNITKLRDEIEILSAEARQQKEQELSAMIQEIQEFDRDSRQALLEKRDNVFREVMEDIRVVVVDKGTKGGYDYILGAQNILYANEKYDMTEEVIKEINK